MDVTTILTDVISLLFGGGVGVAAMQIYTARVNKKKLSAEAEDAQVDVDHKKLTTKYDAFDTLYQQLNKCISDYAAISEEYREHREKTRKYEESVQEQIHNKCLELATLKSKVTYLKGIRCYDFTCKNRIKTNPDKDIPDNIPQKAEEETE